MTSRARILLTLFVFTVLAGCRPATEKSATDSASGLAISSPAVAMVPLPTEAELAALGPKHDVDLRWHIDDPAMIIVVKPQRFLKSHETLANAAVTLVRNMPLFPQMFSPILIERVVVSTRVVGIPIPGETTLQPLPVRVSEVNLVEATTPEDFFKQMFPNVQSIPTVTSGTQKYYDIGSVAKVPPPMAIGIAFPDPKTVVLVEGESATITEAFDGKQPRGAAIDRLSHLPPDGDVTAVVSHEGGAAADSIAASLFAQFPFPEPLQKVLGSVKAATAVVFAANSDAAGTPLLEVTLATPNAADAGQIKEQVEGWLLGSRVSLGAMTPADREGIPVAFLESLIGAIATTVDGGLVRVTSPRIESWNSAINEFLTSQEQGIRYQAIFQRLEAFARAFVQYNATNGFFPQRGICGPDGTPLLSWRVAILPLLGYGELFAEFNISEPWDSEHNKPLADKMPPIFALPKPVTPNDAVAEPNKTTFRLFDSEGTPFANRLLKMQQITNPQSTAMLVSVDPSQAVVWTAPDPLACDIETIKTVFPHELIAILWSGQAFVASKISPEDIEKMIKGQADVASP
ncbi:MAG: DUF1559 domain-containing protein [Thermoguttaceae bacterium]